MEACFPPNVAIWLFKALITYLFIYFIGRRVTVGMGEQYDGTMAIDFAQTSILGVDSNPRLPIPTVTYAQ